MPPLRCCGLCVGCPSLCPVVCVAPRGVMAWPVASPPLAVSDVDGLGTHPRVIRVPLLPRGRGSVAPGQRQGRRPGDSAQGPPYAQTKDNQPRDPEQEGNRKGAKPSMPRQGSFHSLPHTQIHYTYYYRFESCGGPRSLFLYICLLQLLFSITAGPI